MVGPGLGSGQGVLVVLGGLAKGDVKVHDPPSLVALVEAAHLPVGEEPHRYEVKTGST